MLLTDDQSYHLGMTGVKGLKTPNIDGLARRGVFFSKAYATAASCAPCRGSLLTGMYPHANGHWRNTVGPGLNMPDKEFTRESSHVDQVGVHEDIVTLIELLQQSGYFTGITQKFHLSPAWKFPFAFRAAASCKPASQGEAAKKFLLQAHHKPFFLQVNIGNTHRPYRRHIQEAALPEVDPAEVQVPPCWPNTEITRQDYAEYLSTVQHADAVIKAVLDELKNSGREEETIVIYTSDQGFCYHRAKATAYDWGVHVPLSFTGKGIRTQVQSEELVSHVDIMPTILDYAGIKIPATVQGVSLRAFLEGRSAGAGRKYIVSEHNAHGAGKAEYYPTRSITDGRYRYILNLQHEVVPDYPIERFVTDPEFAAKPKGPAWMPWDATPSVQWQNRAFAEIIHAKDDFPEQYELLKATFFRPQEELYDLQDDPYEMRNLASNPEYSAKKKQLAGDLRDWMKKSGDSGDPRAIIRRTNATATID
ncbi:MAG: sulfatase [Kiritimatiellae bacterium]|nr:sulfatase [Kiritimatiellia bacterium]